jgi:outer membrane receptor protein involved in Fe transport
LTFDLTFGVQKSGGAWSLKVWGKNITDETVILAEAEENFVTIDPPSTELLGYSANPRAPRSFGVTADYRF